MTLYPNGKKMINIKALSFDLDDTLYDNKPVINNAYQLLYAYLKNNYPNFSNSFTFDSFITSAIKIKQNHPDIADLNMIRRLHIKATLTTAGYTINSSKEQQAFDVFWQARQNIELFPEAKDVLLKLSKQLPLVAISNGNACIKSMGLEQFFQFSVSPLDTGQAKPHPSMFLYASEKLNIKPQELLHIGDMIDTDIIGAHQAGCRSVWFNQNQQQPINNPADLIIENLSDLLTLNFY